MSTTPDAPADVREDPRATLRQAVKDAVPYISDGSLGGVVDALTDPDSAVRRAMPRVIPGVRDPETAVGLRLLCNADPTDYCGMAEFVGVMLGVEIGKPSSGPRMYGHLLGLLKALDAVPAWRERMGEMAALSPGWAAIAAHWPEIEAVARLREARPGRSPQDKDAHAAVVFDLLKLVKTQEGAR